MSPSAFRSKPACATRALAGPWHCRFALIVHEFISGDSLNISARGSGNAVLIKSALPWPDAMAVPAALQQMLRNNSPDARGQQVGRDYWLWQESTDA